MKIDKNVKTLSDVEESYVEALMYAPPPWKACCELTHLTFPTALNFICLECGVAWMWEVQSENGDVFKPQYDPNQPQPTWEMVRILLNVIEKKEKWEKVKILDLLDGD